MERAAVINRASAAVSADTTSTAPHAQQAMQTSMVS
jgi:hypothetical protein